MSVCFFVGTKYNIICFANIQRQFVAFKPGVHLYELIVYKFKFYKILMRKKHVGVISK